MKTIEFLKERLSKLSLEFSQIQIKYAYNAQIETHIVELVPEKEYYENKSLDDSWIDISLDFSKLFPNENISFISSDSSLAIQQPELEWNCKHINDLDFLTEEFYSEFKILQNEIQGMSFPTSFHFEQELMLKCTYNFQLENQNKIDNRDDDFTGGEDIQYAQAA